MVRTMNNKEAISTVDKKSGFVSKFVLIRLPNSNNSEVENSLLSCSFPGQSFLIFVSVCCRSIICILLDEMNTGFRLYKTWESYKFRRDSENHWILLKLFWNMSFKFYKQD